MKRNCKTIATAIFSLLAVTIFATQSIELNGETTDFQINPQGQMSLSVSVEMGDLEVQTIQTERGEFSRLVLPNFHRSNELGAPELPEVHRLIELPQDAMPRVEIVSETIEEINLAELGIENPIFPAQPSLSKSQNANDVPFEWNQEIYTNDEFSRNKLAEVLEIGQMRAVRVGNLVIRPVEYNPASGVLRIHKNIEILITFDGADISATQDLHETYASPVFESAYNRLANHGQFSSRDDLVGDKITFVIISHPTFESQLQEFVQWKTEKGFVVVEGYLDVIGFSTTEIKNFIQDLYNNPTADVPAPSFVLFVGDVAQVPAWNGDAGSHVTDLDYVNMTGDYMPEIYFGRFSATNSSELQPQIDKTMEYEKYAMPDPSFLGEVVMIAGMDSSHGSTWGNGQINYGTENYFNAAHGIYSNTYLYPESGSNSGNIISNVSAGVGYVNYTAHGSETSWADPSFTISNINSLQNSGQYPTVVGNCCSTNAFDTGECFGEAWLRVANKGAIAYIGGSNSTYWDEDYWWGVGAGSVVSNPTYETTGQGAYDGIFHDHGESENNFFITNYGIIMAGNLAVVEGGSQMTDYYWEIYHNMGDPSVMTYFGVPAENNVSYLPILTIGTDVFSISAEPYSYVGLSMDGVLYGSGTVGASGNLDLAIAPISNAGTATVVVTGQNLQPFIGTVEVGNADGPYPVVDEYSVSTSDGDAIIEFNESGTISMVLKNVGNETIPNGSVALSLSDPYITLIDANENIMQPIIPEGTLILADAFSFEVGYNVPNNYSFTIGATITSGWETWYYNLNFIAFAPELSNVGVSVNDADGQLDPGETADISIYIENSGGASVNGAYAIFTSNDQYLTINSNQFDIGNIEGGATVAATFNVTASADTPIGHVVPFTLNLEAAGEYGVTLNGSLTVGLTFEDFESGNFLAMPWQFSGNADWQISTDAYAGDFSAKSGTISDNSTSEMYLSANVTASDVISFYYKVSSEDSYDYLRFYIDGTEMSAWAGEVNWTQATYNVSSGEHTFRWIYEKDGSVSNGSDCAWIDEIIFPPIGAPAYPDISVDVSEISANVEAGQQAEENFGIANNGDGELQFSIFASVDSKTKNWDNFLKLSKDEVDPRPSVAPNRGSGGPDGFGYFWIDSDEAGGPGYNWVEINATGTDVGTGDDSNWGSFDLGFVFNYYGNEYSSVRVCTNGWLSFTSSATNYSNDPIPTSEQPNALLAPFWDDLNPNDGGTIYYKQDGNRFIVEFDGVPHYGGGGNETFQVIINADGTILYQYKIVGDGTGCTVGIENDAGTDGLQVAYNASYLHNDLAILFYSDYTAPWMSVSPMSGIVAPGGSETINVSFDATELADGVFTGSITIYSNDPETSNILLPVTLEVGPAGPECVFGDVNADGAINVLDIVIMVNFIILQDFPTDDEFCAADVNEDGVINILDIVQVINLIFSPNLAREGAKTVKITIGEKQIILQTDGAIGGIQFKLDGNGTVNALSSDWQTFSNDGNFVQFGIESSLPAGRYELVSGSDAQIKDVIIADVSGNEISVNYEFSITNYELKEAYPNPFNPMTIIRYQLPVGSRNAVTLSIYDIQGRLVESLVNEPQDAGYYSVNWDASGLASGVYFYQLNAGAFSETKKMVLLR